MFRVWGRSIPKVALNYTFLYAVFNSNISFLVLARKGCYKPT